MWGHLDTDHISYISELPESVFWDKVQDLGILISQGNFQQCTLAIFQKHILKADGYLMILFIAYKNTIIRKWHKQTPD